MTSFVFKFGIVKDRASKTYYYSTISYSSQSKWTKLEGSSLPGLPTVFVTCSVGVTLQVTSGGPEQDQNNHSWHQPNLA